MFVCVTVRSGMATGATLHRRLKTAKAEARCCGDSGFIPEADDIAVFKVDASGACVGERLYAYTPKKGEIQWENMQR